MKNCFVRFSKRILTIFFFVIMTAGCRYGRNVAYFSNIVRDTIYPDNQIFSEYVIRPNDLLNISCATMDEEMTKILNGINAMGSGNGPGGGGYSGSAAALSMPNGGFLVNKDGYITYPFEGAIKVAGLTKNIIADSLRDFFIRKELLNDAIFDVRVQNFRVTILGEVNRPSVIIVPNEKISITEALGMVGDLTIYGKRENILLVREENNKRVFKRINLNTDDIFKSDYYYLKANDLIYVEPKNAKKIASTEIPVILPLVLSSLILIVTFFNYLK